MTLPSSVTPPDVSNAGGPDFAAKHVTATNGLLTEKAGRGSSSQSTITLGTPATGQQTASIQLKDAMGANIAKPTLVDVYMCTDTAGATPSSSGAATSVTATTGNLYNTVTAKLKFRALTNAAGLLVLNINNTGSGGVYTDRVVVIPPDGRPIVSAALAVPTS